MRRERLLNLVLALILLLIAGWLAYPRIRGIVLPLEASDALRGRDLAASLGCFSCHGAEGRGGVSNPGSSRETIPGFTGSTLMMYVHGDNEIREYILDGKPERLKQDADFLAQEKAQAIVMPAYRNHITRAQLESLVAFVRSVSGMVVPKAGPPAQGVDIVQRMGCYGCHGALGMGGRENPGSLKGYIPGFSGEDFRELVRDDDELREWIREGSLRRIDQHWIGGIFAKRQLIKMPAYKRFLSDAEIETLVAYLRWINSGAPAREPMS
ncbi:MAG TPA: c-type cytochrome [Candidatus Bathyarchaeia archaeon]|nr:c-type cytochrome [Candidatus Bathyarchaeia archaeon]